jgi:DUF4097 and DUF4098 domain-containing protein YvlB
MKRMMAVPALLWLTCSLAAAQDIQGDRVVVPARNSTRPRLVKVETHNGGVSIKAYSGNEVIVETKGRQRREQTNRDGMRRVNLPPTGLEVDEEDNVVTVRLANSSEGDISISVPANTSLNIMAHNGAITVEGVHGEISAQSQNGKIHLLNVGGTVLANTHNEEVKVTMDRVDPSKPLSFASWNGNIDVTLPSDFKSNVKLKCHNGDIWSDFDVKLSPSQTVTEKSGPPNGNLRVRTDSTYSGTINGGGVEASFSTYNGNVYIRKAK